MMVRIGSIFLIMLVSVMGAMAEGDARTPSIQDLDHLIGKWRYVDQSTELAGFDYREEGVINCNYALDGKYIQCDGAGHYGDKTRTYVDYISYNNISETFVRTGMFGNHPAIASFTMNVSDDGMTIEQFGTPMHQRDGSTSKNWGVINFSDNDHYVWKVHVNRSTKAPDYWPLSFISTYERISDEQNNE